MSTAGASNGSSSSSKTVAENEYIAQLAAYIRHNSQRLSATAAAASRGSRHDGQSSWTTTLLGTSNPLKPLTLTLSLYHLYYVLLKIQEAGFADVGDLDVQLNVGHNRRPSTAYDFADDKADARSVRTGWSLLSVGASSIGSGWWGASGSSSSSNPTKELDRNLRLIYTAFTLLPSLRIVMREQATKGKGKQREIEGFPFGDYPGDRMLPLKAFKSLQRLEVEGVDARCLLFTQEWDNLQVLQVRDSGLEDITDVLLEPGGSKRDWGPRIRMLDLEGNDLTNLDVSDLEGLERLHSLSLRKNLLNTVPTALANLTSLRGLDLSDNMIDSVLAIYKALPALTLCARLASIQSFTQQLMPPFTRLNLRDNRIHSLCGLERLLSLQELDLRSNEIYDVSELSRLVMLPHLRKLYVSDGNPFVQEPDATKGNGWRIDLFNAFLQDPCHRRSLEDLPEIDGFPASWNERRYLVESSQSGFVSTHAASSGNGRSRQTTAHSHEQGKASEPTHIVVTPRKMRQPSAASATSKRTSTATAIFGQSPPPPVPKLPAEHLAAPLSPARIDSDDSSVRALKPKVVKKKHRRVVDLDGQDKDRSSRPVRQHDRSVSSPGWAQDEGDNGALPTGPPKSIGKGYHTLSSLPSGTGKSRTANRKLSESTFAPAPITDGTSGSGSEVEEFRRKMEQLRDEVGAENWLSVYASQGNNSTMKK